MKTMEIIAQHLYLLFIKSGLTWTMMSFVIYDKGSHVR